jgi:hypothetical protein
MVLFITVLILFLAGFAWTMVRGADAWPFSHYPMFSGPINVAQVCVFRLALETIDGERIWWQSEFFRYPEFVGRMLKRTYQLEQHGGPTAAWALLERQRYLAEVLRLLEEETGTLERYRAFHLVQRTVNSGSAKELSVNEQTVLTIPLAGIKRVDRAD